MTPTDLSEQALELRIAADLTGFTPAEVKVWNAGGAIQQEVASYDAEWVLGSSQDYDRKACLDIRHLIAFLQRTQPEIVANLNLSTPGYAQTQFLDRLRGEIASRGVVDVLRKGISHLSAQNIRLYYPTPSAGNPDAAARYRDNIFSVTRQLRYSLDEDKRSLDLALFVNGLPIATMELKNQITNQDVNDAMGQYRRDRSPKERLFQEGVCAFHLAVDDNEVWFTTRLAGDKTRFLPFNKGFNDGAGNPPNMFGIKTDYLWKDVLRRDSLANLIEHYLVRMVGKDDEGKKTVTNLFPRYHQLDVVRRLLGDISQQGVGRRYLIQHSAGSGKSFSIAWLVHQLIELEWGGKPTFDTVLIVTDRTALDDQLSGTVSGIARQKWTTKQADDSTQLATLISNGQRIILTTVQKFPFVIRKVGTDHRDRKFAIVIDEAHSSQGGKAAGQLNAALAKDLEIEPNEDGTISFEDQMLLAVAGRRMLDNASYFAFTATPKNRTLELFGERHETEEGPKFRPFHTYTMKQAIEERFILDVLASYTPYKSYYHLVKTVEDDPEFDRKRAQKKLRHYVESHPSTVQIKAGIIVDHFHSQVIAKAKINGQARAMVVTGSIDRAIDYWLAIRRELAGRKSPYKAIVAFTGEREVEGAMSTEAQLNEFPSRQIPDRFKQDPYRLLVVADKFQTGFDEPLLHTMYVDKRLASVKAVQTLSRLNRSHPGKTDTFVLDFFNEPDEIEQAFQPFFRTTLLSGETDPNQLHDLKHRLDEAAIYTWDQVTSFVDQYLANIDMALLHSVLDLCRANYESDQLDDEGRIEFKGDAKAFVRKYGFLSSILPYTNVEWERLSIFLKFLIPKLPAPDDPDLAKGILEAIDMDSYRVQARQSVAIALADEEGVIDQPVGQEGGFVPVPDIVKLSDILDSFNALFTDAGFTEEDRVKAINNIKGPIMDAIAGDSTLEATFAVGDIQNTEIQFRKAFEDALGGNVHSNLKVYKKQQDEPLFREQLQRLVFQLYKDKRGGLSQ